jgi:hypothetical protein
LGQHEVVVRLSSTLAPSVKVLLHREGEPPESALDMVPEEEVVFEEEPTIFEEVMAGEEEPLDGEPFEVGLLEELSLDEDVAGGDAAEPEAPEES